jgi:hypothetical protein
MDGRSKLKIVIMQLQEDLGELAYDVTDSRNHHGVGKDHNKRFNAKETRHRLGQQHARQDHCTESDDADKLERLNDQHHKRLAAIKRLKARQLREQNLIAESGRLYQTNPVAVGVTGCGGRQTMLDALIRQMKT